MSQDSTFGNELRRRREDQGYSVSTFARMINYDKSVVSRIENGKRLPSADFCLICDQKLDAGGSLVALGTTTAGKAETAVPAPRAFPSAEIALAWNVQQDWVAPGPGDPWLGALYRQQVTGLEELTCRCDPSSAAVVAAASVDLMVANGEAHEQARGICLYPAVQMALLAGWMEQESGRIGRAQQVTRSAMALAERIDADDLVGTALLRLAEIELCQGRPGRAEELTDIARQRGGPALTALALQRHALVAAYNQDDDGLKSVLVELDRIAPDHEDLYRPPGPWAGQNSRALVEGWCYGDLRDHDRARDQLDGVLRTVPATDDRRRAILAARLARAHLGMRDLARTEEYVDQALQGIARSRSATAWTELSRLSDDLGNQVGHRSALDLRRRIVAAREG